MSEQKMREATDAELYLIRKYGSSRGHYEWRALEDAFNEGRAAGAAAALSQREAVEPVVVLPDGSAFATASYPLPADHWLYSPRQYTEGADEPQELPQPILTHALRKEVMAAVRYAVRGATMCGKETDFDPDALVQNAVYALCGPFGGITAPPSREVPEEWVEAVRVAVGVLDSDAGPLTRNACADGLRAMLASKGGV